MTHLDRTKWDLPGRWELSPHNFAPEVLDDSDYSGDVTVCESTIRKMDVTPGSRVPYPIEDKIELCAKLDQIGVKVVGCNPTHFYGTARNKGITDGVRAIAKQGFGFKLLGSQFGIWRISETVRRERVDWLADMGINIMTVTMPGSEPTRERYRVDIPLEKLAEVAIPVMQYAKSRGMQSGPLFADSARGDIDELARVINLFIQEGADIVGLVDSYGALSPQGTRYFLKRLNAALDKRVPILYHAHDDFGLATAIATTAALEGCIPDVSVNGIGDRGFADTAQVVVALELLYGARTGIKLDKLTGLSQLVERITGISMQPHRPVTGSANYVPLGPETYIALLQGKPYDQSAFQPEVVGRRSDMVWWEGMATPATVRAKLTQLGLPAQDEDVERGLAVLVTELLKLQDYPAWLPEAQVAEMLREAVVGDRATS